MVKEGAEDLSCLLNCLSVSLLGFSSFINNKKLNVCVLAEIRTPTTYELYFSLEVSVFY